VLNDVARKRMIDPGIWQSQDFGNLTTLAKLVFIGLFSQADDEGRGRANPQYIKNTLFPYDEKMQKSDIEKSFAEIAEHMSIQFYKSGGSEYYALTNWSIWQRVEKPTPSRLPDPEDCDNSPRWEGKPPKLPKSPKPLKDEADPVAERGFSPEVEARVREWLQYKTERREGYKTTGLRNLLSEIANNIKKYGESPVTELIGMCMSSNWAGIIWDRLGNGKQAVSGASSTRNYDEKF
jgi:hypothetical protein